MTEWLDSPDGTAAVRDIGAAVDERREELVDLLGALIAEKSPNPPGDCSGVARVLTEWLSRRGIACQAIEHVSIKPNLVSTIEGSIGGRHLVLNGHMDTIGPGDVSAWTVPLHQMTRRDGKLYGLGSGNMKGALAALTLAYASLHDMQTSLKGRVTYTAVADETVFGPDGAGFLLDQRPDLCGDAVICGEGPGDMTLGIAEKGVLWAALEANCPPGQGMLTTRGSSAIARLAHALTQIDAWNDEDVQPPADIASVQTAAGAHRLRLSVNPGTITGGHFVSQVASEATAEVDFRLPPGLTMKDMSVRLDALIARHPSLRWRKIKGWDPNWTAETSTIAKTVSAAAAKVRGRVPPPVVRLPASDASRWRALGVPSICYGPQPELASGIDDYVHEQDVVDCAKVYALSALAFLNA
ncbi:MAG: M20/M25/M40 family metallo-hydrolase [Hyphomicrobiaceae bacterium]